jgi:uncharacterized protein (TIGR02391 family)
MIRATRPIPAECCQAVMARSIYSIVPYPVDLLALGANEVGEVLLVYLNSFGPNDSSDVVQHGGEISRHNFFNGLRLNAGYPEGHLGQVEMKLAEGWEWLRSNGLLIEIPTQPAGWFRRSEKARGVVAVGQIEAYRHAGLLHADRLHPAVRARAYPPFLRGDYDGSIREAFIELEERIRTAGMYSPGDFGVRLMRKAFDPPKGRFVDASLPVKEQEAMRDLFLAAFSFYRNPRGHRRVPDSAVEAAEVVGFASHLMRIVERLTI